MTDSLDDSKIQAIVQRVLREVAEPSTPAHAAAGPALHLSHVGCAGQAVQARSPSGRDGVFSTVDDPDATTMISQMSVYVSVGEPSKGKDGYPYYESKGFRVLAA